MEKLVNEIQFREEDHTYWFWDVRVPSVSEILKYCHFKDDNDFIKQEYLDRGTIIHAITEYIDSGGIGYDIVPPKYSAFVSAYQMFLDENNVEVLESETLLFNYDYLFAGTEDRYINIDGKLTTLDIKLGYYQTWHKIQLAFYAMTRGAKNISNLYLTKEGEYKIKNYPMGTLFNYVSSCSEVYWFRRQRDYKKLKKYVNEVMNNGL